MSTLELGGADGPDVESWCSEAIASEVVSSSSSTTLATIVTAEDEYLESSMEVVGRQLADYGDHESNLNFSTKQSSRRSSSE